MSWFLRKWSPVYGNCSYCSGYMAWHLSWGPSSSPNMVFGSCLKPQVQEIFRDFLILLDSHHDSWENEVMFGKIAARVQDLWLDVFWAQVSGPNVVSRPQTLRSRNFLRFHDFMGFISWLLRKRGYACENCSYGFGLMTWCFLGPSGPSKCSSFWVLNPKEIFWDFMILLDSYHNSWKDEVLFVKVLAIILEIWLDMSFGPKWPKFSFYAPDPPKGQDISWDFIIL